VSPRPAAETQSPPKANLAGLKKHWRGDLVAGFSVALVALPLALGIATAAGAPPISGLISAIVAGLMTTFLRGSHVAINGPGNALIVIVAGGFISFGDTGAFPHILGAMMVAGAIQVLLGVLRLGKLGDLIPAAVVQGMLAAIGLIIIAKQAHVLFGGKSKSTSAVDVFLELPVSIAAAHPAATLIGVVSLGILIVYPRIKVAAVHWIPSPLWVVIFAIPTALILEHTHVLGAKFTLEKDALVSIPADLVGSLVTPSFERITEPAFWIVVFTVTLVCSIENVVSVKAVDKLDSHRRTSNMDRDLIAMGVSTMVSAPLGGLPILTVVARSSVNVNHGAKTGWSNFFHGLILLVFVVFLRPVIEELSLSALAGILVYTGFKLTAPRVFRDTIHKGPDHFLVFGITVVATLEWGLLAGLAVGVVAEFLGHLLILGLPPREVWTRIRETRFDITREPGARHILRARGIANFLAIRGMRRAFDDVVSGERLIVDFSTAMLVDNTLLEYTHEAGRRYERTDEGASFDIIGLETHRAISDHPDALRAKDRGKIARRLTPRQRTIESAAKLRDWRFDPRRDWQPEYLEAFPFFRVHPVEYQDTVVSGAYEVGETRIDFSLADVTFDEGALIPDIYHSTVQVLTLPIELPEMVLEKENVINRALELAGFGDIELEEFPAFSRKFVLQGPDEEAIRAFLTPALLRFLEEEDAFHIECTGREVLVFKTALRISTALEVDETLAFSERLVAVVLGESEGATDEEGGQVIELAQ
jgi:MFS superfamily sulfate permease-like transporter